jgi:hypothetical protein
MKTSTRNLKGAPKDHNKHEGLWAKHHEKILEATLASFDLKIICTCFTSSFKASLKREKVKEDEPKGIPKTFIPSSWVQKPTRCKKLKNKLEREQAAQLHG